MSHTASKCSGERRAFLCCADCKFPIVSDVELIEEKFVSWRKVVYAYELNVLDKDCWCYSATNMHDCRFDVIRVLPTVCQSAVRLSGKVTPEYSWFPGFGWRMAHCASCSSHLGWAFYPLPEEHDEGGRSHSSSSTAPEGTSKGLSQEAQTSKSITSTTTDCALNQSYESTSTSSTVQSTIPSSQSNHDMEEDDEEEQDEEQEVKVDDSTQPAFIGIVLTRLTEKEYSEKELKRLDEERTECRQQETQYRDTLRAILERLNSLPLVISAPFYPMIQAMRFNPLMRRHSRSLLQTLETIHSRETSQSASSAVVSTTTTTATTATTVTQDISLYDIEDGYDDRDEEAIAHDEIAAAVPGQNQLESDEAAWVDESDGEWEGDDDEEERELNDIDDFNVEGNLYESENNGEETEHGDEPINPPSYDVTASAPAESTNTEGNTNSQAAADDEAASSSSADGLKVVFLLPVNNDNSVFILRCGNNSLINFYT